MCSRYIIANTLSQIEAHFGLPEQNITIEPNYNISCCHYAPVITNDKPLEIQLFKFGMIPFFYKPQNLRSVFSTFEAVESQEAVKSECTFEQIFNPSKRKKYGLDEAFTGYINARSEGDSNQSDDPKFHGAKGIIQKKAFRKPIRSQRCLVIATAFIAGPKDTGLAKPYLFYLQNHKNPFAFAGIWDTWINLATLEKENTFAIITTTANTLLQKIGQKRMPVILTDSQAKKWINSGIELSSITSMLTRFDSKLMNAYPISPRINDPDKNDKALIQPVGGRLTPEIVPPTFKIQTQGHYHSKKAQNPDNSTRTMADRIKQINENTPT